MGKTMCVNNHLLSNCDEKPTVWVFRTGFLKEYAKAYPKTVLGDEFLLFDATDEIKNEELNCWFCDECHSFIVFARQDETHELRYDYLPSKDIPKTLNDCAGWEEYMAFRDDDFGDFEEATEGKTIQESIEIYKATRPKYLLSPDKTRIYVFSEDGAVLRGYTLASSNELDLSSFDWNPGYPMYETFQERDIERRATTETKDTQATEKGVPESIAFGDIRDAYRL